MRNRSPCTCASHERLSKSSLLALWLSVSLSRPGVDSPACSSDLLSLTARQARPTTTSARSCAATSPRFRRSPRATAFHVLRVLDGLVVVEARPPSLLDAAARRRRRRGRSRATTSSRPIDDACRDRRWPRTRRAPAAAACSGAAGGTPAVNGKGIGVAVDRLGHLDRHIGARRQGRRGREFRRPAMPSTNDAFGHGTHIAGIIAGRTQLGSVTASLQGRHRARRAPGQRARARPRRRRLHERRHRRHSVGRRQPRQVRASASMNLSLGHPIRSSRASFDPLCLAVEKAVGGGPGRGRLGRQHRQGREGQHGARQRLDARHRAERDHRRRAQHLEHRDAR